MKYTKALKIRRAEPPKVGFSLEPASFRSSDQRRLVKLTAEGYPCWAPCPPHLAATPHEGHSSREPSTHRYLFDKSIRNYGMVLRLAESLATDNETLCVLTSKADSDVRWYGYVRYTPLCDTPE